MEQKQLTQKLFLQNWRKNINPTKSEAKADMQEYGFTLDDYQYLEMPQQAGENYTIYVKTQSGEMEGLVFTSEDQGENWRFTGVFAE